VGQDSLSGPHEDVVPGADRLAPERPHTLGGKKVDFPDVAIGGEVPLAQPDVVTVGPELADVEGLDDDVADLELFEDLAVAQQHGIHSQYRGYPVPT